MGTSSLANSSNSFGDNQLKIDLIANDIMFQKLQVVLMKIIILPFELPFEFELKIWMHLIYTTFRAMLLLRHLRRHRKSCRW